MSVKQWLESLSMSQYHKLFMSNGFDTLAKCSTLTDFDLDRIGVTRVGHRKRILSHLKTALDFSVAVSEFREETQNLPEDLLSYRPVEVGNLIDLPPPDYLAVTGQELPCYPFDLPLLPPLPPSNDVLRVLADIPDSDKKKPVPVPRKSINSNQVTSIPVPKPRAKKPSLQSIEVAETSIGDSFEANAEGSDEPNSVGKSTADVRNFDVDTKTVRNSRYGDGIVYADVVFEPCLPSDLNLSSKAVESASASMLDCVVGNRPESIYSLVEVASPLSSASLARLLMSASYEGDVEDVETPVGEVYFDSPCSKSNVPDGVGSKSNCYAGIWNMTSGVAASQQRRENGLNDNSLDVRFDSSGSSSRDESRAVPYGVAANVPVSSQRPDVAARMLPPIFQAQAQKPPPVPARKPDLKCSNSDPTEISTAKDFGTSIPSSAGLVFSNTEIRTFADTTFNPSPKLAASAPKSRTEATPGGAIDRPPFPTPPTRLAPVQPSKGSAPIPPQPSRNAPLPHCTGEKGKVAHPPFPLLPGRPAPVPPVLLSDASPTPPVLTASTTPPLNMKALLPPVGYGPPPLPPKAVLSAVSSVSETDYSLAGFVADDVFHEEAEISADTSFAESDDTLSDGGEFYDNVFQRSTSDACCQPSTPIASSVSARQTNRKGYLYKLMSVSKKLAKPWQKIWVVFDGAELRYFSSNKSFVSKRIIPLCTMHKVEAETKNGDLHPYCFKLTTIDRVYTFAADDVDDMSWWANIIMKAIIQSENERKSFIQGGEMNSPDIEGYVRMEGSKCKRYLVVKKAKFCFYNTIEDFRNFTPIHRVEMQLASVKDVGRFKLQLFTPHVAFMLIFESQDELNEWKGVFEDSISLGLGDDSVITEVYANLSNRYCADCEMADPEWAAINLGITLCKFCAGVHRSLSWSKVRSLRMDSKVWKPSVRQLLITIGNDNSNNFWEWQLLKENRIDSKTDFNKRRDFILRKYCNKQFCRFHPAHSNQNELNEALCKMVQLGNVLETLELVFSGAEVICSRNNETPVQLARKAKQALQEEFLCLNGGDLDVSQSPVPGTGPWTSGISHRGYLFKTGSNVRGEFLRRWCVLESGVFSYFDTDKSPVANDSIEKKDMLSVGLAFDDRYEFTFEVGTTKQGGRIFLFAAESNDERMLWITKLAKVMANISSMDVERIMSLDRGGNVYIRWATSREWLTTWAEISHKTLKIFNKNDHLFEEVDLRKAKSITYLHPSERCVESFDDGPPFIVHLRNGKNVYLQGDLKIETERWFSTIQKAMTESDHCLANQSLTSDNIPVIVEKCIGYVVLYGLEVEGIYRLNGQHSKVTRLLELFMSDACGLVIKQEEFQVHDVANTLKRFFRSLDDPLLTNKLYSKWIEASGYPDSVTKLQLYKALLRELPQINYHTLKQVITHLARVAEMDQVNKMTVTNLASIFGPVLMRLDEEKDSGFGATNLEIHVAKDLTENHVLLFEVKEEELEQEKKIEEARKKIEMLNNQAVGSQVEQMQDVIIGVHINSKDGDIISLKVSMTMRVQELQDYVIEKAGLHAGIHWSLFEVICNGELERPLHYMEPVVGVTMKWIDWPMEFCRDNFLCLKRNYVYEKILLQEDPHPSMFCELKYASKKAFHKYCFDFSRYCLTYRTSTRAPSPTASWNVEDLVIYVGCQRQRNPPTRWCFSFVCSGEQLVSPYFGHCVCCSSEEELFRWLSVLLRAQHPEGLVPSGSPRGATSQPAPVELRPRGLSSADQESSSESPKTRWLKPISIFQKLSQR